MRGLAILLAAAAALASLPAAAQFTDCKPARQDAEYVVFLSEPEFTPAAFKSRDEMRTNFFDALYRQLDQRRDQKMAEIESIDFSVARCAGRVPKIDGSDFTTAVAKSLYSRKVVVEIWGQLNRAPGQPARPTAQMNYIIMPIRSGDVPGSGAVPAIHSFDYPDRDITGKGFVELVSNADLYAFVKSAIGASAFLNDDFIVAHQMLCRSASDLAQTERRLMATQASQAQAHSLGKLRAYLLELAGKAVDGGRKRGDPPLRLQNPGNPCPAS